MMAGNLAGLLVFQRVVVMVGMMVDEWAVSTAVGLVYGTVGLLADRLVVEKVDQRGFWTVDSLVVDSELWSAAS